MEGRRDGEVWTCLGECETRKASRDGGQSRQFGERLVQHVDK